MTVIILAAIGLLAGVLGGLLGIGGSVLIIPGLIFVMSASGEYHGSQQHLIQAAAMICNVFIAAPAAVAHWRNRAVMPSVIAWLAPSAVVGIVLGVVLSNTSAFARQNGAYLAMLLAAFLLYVVVYNAWRLVDKTNLASDFDCTAKWPFWKLLAVGLPMGLFAGLLGIGGGALCVPLQQTLLRMPLRRAIANSSAAIVMISSLGAVQKNLTLSEHGFSSFDSMKLAALLIPTAMVGSYVGGLLTHRLPRKVLRWVFIIFMLAVAVFTFRDAWKARFGQVSPQESRPSRASHHSSSLACTVTQSRQSAQPGHIA
ncbi:MAG: sulfite exporter TauE/SafE family protein [Patescibacteria group bacterium]|nr:sulfite exporter TauE/SafE family protein [Patescibacteria group bacterium]